MMLDHIGFPTVHAVRFAGRVVTFIGFVIGIIEFYECTGRLKTRFELCHRLSFKQLPPYYAQELSKVS
jgi:hypothetical protein